MKHGIFSISTGFNGFHTTWARKMHLEGEARQAISPCWNEERSGKISMANLHGDMESETMGPAAKNDLS